MAALFSFCALFSSAAFAQLDGIVAKPNVKVDDRWLYRRMDHRFEPPVLLYELRVTFVDAHAIHTVLARQGRPRESDATWTSEWNSVVSVDDGVVEIKSGLLQFPLSVGRAYQSMWEMRRPRAGKFHVPQVKRWRRGRSLFTVGAWRLSLDRANATLYRNLGRSPQRALHRQAP